MGTSAQLTAGVFKHGSEYWLQLRPSGSNLGGEAGVVAIHPLGLATGGPEAKRWYMETTSFFHELQNKDSEVGPWYVLQRTVTTQGDSDGVKPIFNPDVAFDALNLALREVRGTQQGSLPFQGPGPPPWLR